MSPQLLYIECDVPDGQTLGEWRRRHGETRRSARRSFRRLVRRLAH